MFIVMPIYTTVFFLLLSVVDHHVFIGNVERNFIGQGERQEDHELLATCALQPQQKANR